jgi:hypothetical protein
MRAPGMNLPATQGFMGILTAAPSTPPTYLDGAIGTSFFTPETEAFNATRKKYGSLDDPDAGGYSLAQIDWDKDNGDAEMTMLEAADGGWYAPSPGVDCSCPDHSQCGCN